MRVKRLGFLACGFVLLFILPWIHLQVAWAQPGTGEQVIPLSPSGYERANALAFSAGGKYLAVGGLSGVYLFDFQHLSALNFIPTDSWARSLAFIPGGDILATGLFDHTVKLWEVPENRLVRTLAGHQGWVRSIAVSGDGALLASASDDNTLRVWEAGSGNSILVIRKNTDGIRAVALSPDGKLAAGALGDRTVRVWSVPDGRLMYTLAGHEDWVRCLAFSPDGKLLASGSFDKTILLWDMASGSLAKSLKGHTSSVLGLAFSPDGGLLASASVDMTVRVWDVHKAAPLDILVGHTDFVYSVAYSPDGKFLASGGGDNVVRIWNLEGLQNAPSSLQTGAELDQNASSTCGQCHHRRGSLEPARVIELSCEGCHPFGANLSWCAAFTRAGSAGKPVTSYRDVQEVSGVPVGRRDIAVVITSPGNGESLYVKGKYQAPETISGKVYYSGQLKQVKVRLDILSGGQVAASRMTNLSVGGEFTFGAVINPGSPPAQGPDVFCRSCHGRSGSEPALPPGEVHLRVTASAPGGSQAYDERWLRVDSSGEEVVPVRVIEEATGDPVPGVRVQASAFLYEWRSRTSSAASGENGEAPLPLESLSQARTVYTLTIPSQVVGGRRYSGIEPVTLALEPGQASFPPVTLSVRAVDLPAAPEEQNLPASEAASPPAAPRPSLGSLVQSWLVKAGIRSAQALTFLTYAFILVVLPAAPLLWLAWRQRRRIQMEAKASDPWKVN